jgi:hypothetical protein
MLGGRLWLCVLSVRCVTEKKLVRQKKVDGSCDPAYGALWRMRGTLLLKTPVSAVVIYILWLQIILLECEGDKLDKCKNLWFKIFAPNVLITTMIIGMNVEM